VITVCDLKEKLTAAASFSFKSQPKRQSYGYIDIYVVKSYHWDEFANSVFAISTPKWETLSRKSPYKLVDVYCHVSLSAN
jgi:hypothetical protein